MSRIEDLVAELGKLIVPRKATVAAAESCTGGQLCAALVADPDVSGAFERGFVVYSIDAKCELFGLQREPVERCEGVSEDIACAMARAALKESRATLAVAITGFAGPRKGDEEVGLVHIAVAGEQNSAHRVLHLGDIGREKVCDEAVAAALELLVEHAG